MTHRLPRHSAALAGFLLLTLAYLQPITARFSTHLLGTLGEVGGGLQNFWFFHRALTTPGESVWWTDLQYWPHGCNLLLVHYMLPLDLLAHWLMPFLSAVSIYNLFCVAAMVLAGWCVYLFLTDLGYEAGPAFAAGVSFEFAPAFAYGFMWGRGLFEAVYFVAPLFAWTFSRALRSRRLGDAALAAASLGLAYLLNFYFFLGCAVAVPAAFLWLERPLPWRLRPRPDRPWARRAANAAWLAASVWVIYSLSQGQRRFHGHGTGREILAYVLPYLAFWAAAALRLALSCGLEARWRPQAWRWKALRPYLATVALWAAGLWPLLATAFWFMASGGYGKPPSPAWRGGGNPLDPVAMLLPSTHHPLWGGLTLSWSRLLDPGNANGATMFALVPLAGALWLWRGGLRGGWTRLWAAALLFYALLAMGPWLRLFGVDTFLPLPFYLLHLLPVFNNMPDGQYFAVWAALFSALLFADCLRRLMARLPPARAAWLPLAAVFCVAAECATRPSPMSRLDPPRLLERLGELPDGALLPIPVGANFHIIVNPGPVGREFTDLMSYQFVHGKPYIGGFMSRVPRRVYDLMMADAVFKGLLEAQEGAPPSKTLLSGFLMSRYFRDSRVRYVLVETSMAPEALLAAVRAWPLRLLDQDQTMRLYEVVSDKRLCDARRP